MTDEWQDISEDDGITLGPEEALAREIAKSKALKVERLQLKDCATSSSTSVHVSWANWTSGSRALSRRSIVWRFP